MIKTLQARYIGGVLKPTQPLPLAEGALVGISVTLPPLEPGTSLSFQGMWLKVYVDALEQAVADAHAGSAAHR